MTTSEDTSAEMGSQQRTVIAAASAVGTLFAIAYVGYLVFEDPVYGAVAGAISGAGTFLLFQYVLAGGLADESENDGSDDAGHGGLDAEPTAGGRQTGGGIHGGAAGFALDAGGVVMVAAGFVTEGRLLIGALAAVAVALVGYVVLERTLPRPET